MLLSLQMPLLPTILYIDGEQDSRHRFLTQFRKEFKVLLAADHKEAMELLEQHHIHVVITDQILPGISGAEVLRMIRERFPAVRRMLVTAYADLQAVVDALNRGGACYFIQKPWDADEVRSALMRALAEIQAESEQKNYTDRILESNRQLEFALRQSLLS